MKAVTFCIDRRKSGVDMLKRIIQDLGTYGRSSRCPAWSVYTRNMSLASFEDSDGVSCDLCYALFPTHGHEKCPCDVYTSHYLIGRLNEIIKHNENLNKS